MYQKIFPLGDSSKYAGLVFKSIDQNQTGAVTFGDFMDFLSMLTKGSVEEKMLWSFHFYDVNKDGYISREEMIKVIKGRLNFLYLPQNIIMKLQEKGYLTVYTLINIFVSCKIFVSKQILNFATENCLERI